MSGINKVIIIGRLGRDPEIRYTKGGSAVCEISVATSERYKDREGQQQERPEWHRVVAWGAQAENAAKYLGKGSQVYVEGSLRTEQWEDRDGNKRYTTKVHAQRIQFLDSRGSGYAPPRGGKHDPAPVSDYGAAPAGMDDDIPF